MITAQNIGASAMMDRLTRIWVPVGTPRENISASFDGNWHRRLIANILVENGHLYDDSYRRKLENDRSSYLQFSVDLGDEACFDYSERFNMWSLYSTEPFPTDDEEPGYKFYGYMGCLSFDDECGLFIAGRGNNSGTLYSDEKRTQFSTKWLSFFRRNCWLCGCNIECSRQERLKWVQGLTRKEIEEWNLKI